MSETKLTGQTKDTLITDFQNIMTLLRYLYMGHKVVIHNCIDVPLEFQMDSNLNIGMTNLNYPEQGARDAQDVCRLSYLRDMCEQLKEEPAERSDCFKNRWEEIENWVASTMALNELHHRT